jgi:hypothetical protein
MPRGVRRNRGSPKTFSRLRSDNVNAGCVNARIRAATVCV